MAAQRGRSDVSISDLVRANLLKEGQSLRLTNHDEVRATVTADGLKFGGRIYLSPSTAAVAARNGPKRMNGWLAWKARVGDRWRPISEVRDQYSNG
jgi:hypothetical protein